MELQSTKHLVIPFLAFLALIPCFPGCSSDDDDDASATLWRLLGTGTPDVGLEGSGGTGFTRFDDRSGNVSTGASSIAFGAGVVYSTGGGADRSTGAADLLIWKLDP